MIGLLRRAWRLGDEVLGMNARNLEYIYRLNPRSGFRVVDDKIETKQRLAEHGVPVPETLAVFAGYRDTRRLADVVRDRNGFVVKPSCSSGGKGILVVRRHGEGWAVPSHSGPRAVALEDIREHTLQILSGLVGPVRLHERAFLETLLEPDELLGGMSEGGIPDVRVLVVRNRPALAMARIPTRRSGGRANLHQGALGLGVDLATGRTTRAILGTRTIERHPDNGAALEGIEIPHWSRILELALRSSGAVELAYVGVDIIVDRRRGPLVIELNARPGLNIQIANRVGLRDVLPPPEEER